jgi:hypothetical protein
VSATTDLLSEERVDAGEAHDLRQLRGVAKRVFVRDCRRGESWAMTEEKRGIAYRAARTRCSRHRIRA